MAQHVHHLHEVRDERRGEKAKEGRASLFRSCRSIIDEVASA
jgi:hypothetical protein